MQHSNKSIQRYGSVWHLWTLEAIPTKWNHSPITNLICCIKVSSMFWQAFHDIMVSPSRCCQEWSLSFSVFNVHITACFTKCFGNRVVAMPRSTMQWGFFFLETQNKSPQWKKQKQMLQEAIHLLNLERKQDGRKKSAI